LADVGNVASHRRTRAAGGEGIVHARARCGHHFIDTANVYSAGESETLLGHAIAGRRHEVVLATKVRGRMGTGPNQVGLSRICTSMESVERQPEATPDRLHSISTKIHRFDALTDQADTMRTLDDLVRAGKGPLHRVART